MQRQSQRSTKGSCGTVENVPILVRIKEKDWRNKSQEVLKYCINLLDPKRDWHIIILYDDNFSSLSDVESTLKTITNRDVIHGDNFIKMSSDVNSLEQKNDQAIIVSDKNFVGCEATSVIYLTHDVGYLMTSLTKRIPNLVCIHVLQGLNTLGNIYNLTRFEDNGNLKGIKEDNTFYSTS